METRSTYHISCDQSRLDFELIHEFLTNSYWSPGIPVDVVKRGAENSICFGAYDKDGNQVGYARAITDKASFSYLADVFVLPEHRGKGVSKLIMEAYNEHPELQGLRRHTLATRDAHKLYEKYGFTPLDSPNIWMQKHNPDVYKNEL